MRQGLVAGETLVEGAAHQLRPDKAGVAGLVGPLFPLAGALVGPLAQERGVPTLEQGQEFGGGGGHCLHPGRIAYQLVRA